MTKAARPIVLLLTATVDPGAMILVKRRDPKRRFKDYKQALRKWCRVPGFDSIIFCENSGFDLSPLRKWAASVPKVRSRVQFISFQGNDYPPYLGKGYGEMGILKHVFALAKFAEDTLVVKATGRYYARNVESLVDQIYAHAECEVFCNVDSGFKWAESVIFAGKVSFYKNYLLPLHSQINDSADRYLEHILADAIRAGLASGTSWMPWSASLELRGVSGTHDRPPRWPRQGLARARMWMLDRSFRMRRLLGLYRRPS